MSSHGHQPGLPHARAILLTLHHIAQDHELLAKLKGCELNWYVFDSSLYKLLTKARRTDQAASGSRAALSREVQLIHENVQSLSLSLTWCTRLPAMLSSKIKLARRFCRATANQSSVHAISSLQGSAPSNLTAAHQELVRAHVQHV